MAGGPGGGAPGGAPDQGQGNPMGLNPIQQTGAQYTAQAGQANPYQTAAGGIISSSAAPNPFALAGGNSLAGFAGGGGVPYPTVSGGPGVSAGSVSATDIGGLPQVGGPGPYNNVNAIDTQQMQFAQDQAKQLASGPIGQSPATLAAMKAWETLVKPQTLAAQALTGNLGGGATQEAMAMGSTAAAVPLIQQEVANRAALVPQMGQLGLGVSGQDLAAQQANQGAALTSSGQRMQGEMANQSSALEAARANQSANLQAGLANQQAGLTAGLANQSSGLQAQLANQSAALQAAGLSESAANALANLGLGLGGQQLAAGSALGNLGGQLNSQRLASGGQLAQIGGMGFGQQMQAANQMAGLGQQQAQTYQGALQSALKAAGMPYDVSAQQAQAAYNDFLRLAGLSQQVNIGPTGSYLGGSLQPGAITTQNQSGGGMFGS